MGIRLVRYGLEKVPSAGTYDHQELLNRDATDSHPISAITGLETALEEVTKAIDDSSETIKTELELYIDEAVKNNGGLDFGETSTQTMKLTYNRDKKTLSGDVRIASVEDNAIEVSAAGGLFVDKFHKIETVSTLSVNLDMNESGDSLKEIFSNGNRFVHHNSSWSDVFSNTSYPNWRYLESSDYIEAQTTTGYFSGIISTIEYESYVHKASITASGSSGFNGLVIGHIIDTDGKPHTLSVGINIYGEGFYQSFYYGLIYDQYLPDQQIIGTKMPVGMLSWTGKQFIFEVKKNGNKISCGVSNANETEINPNTVIEIDLNNYTWGSLFTGLVRYGYCNHYQSNSIFRKLYFKGKSRLKANVNISKQTSNSLELKDDGLFVNAAAPTIMSWVEEIIQTHIRYQQLLVFGLCAMK